MPHAPGARRTRFARMAAGGLLLLLAACGSTVPMQQVQDAGVDAGLGGADGEGVTTGTAEDAAAGADGGGAGGESSGATAVGTGGGGAGGAARAGSGNRTTATTRGSGSGSTGSARGVSDKEIKIGIEYAVDAGAVVSAFGAKGVSSGDWKVEFQIVVDDINERGGVLGRKLVPVWQGYRFEGDWPTQEQAACERFTKDAKVFGVVAFAHSDNVLSCFENAGLIQTVTGGFTWFDEQGFRTYPRLMQAPGLTLDRLATVLADNLTRQGFFADNAVIGVVSHEQAMWERGYKVLEARLATYGRSVKYTMRLPEFHSARDGGAFGAKVKTEMAKMKDAGVDHVLFLQQTITGALLFMNEAQTSLWFPRYGLTTNDGPHALTTNVPEQQLQRSMGVGFSPNKDVGESLISPGAKQCLDAFVKRGVTWRDESAKGQSLQRCDHVWALVEAIRAGGTPITTSGTMAGLERLGTSYPTTTAFVSDYRNGRRDGAGAVRVFAFDTGCKCYRYNGGTIPVQ